MPQGQGELRHLPVHVTPADFGGQVGAVLQETGSQLMQQALLRQPLNNESAVNDVINQKFFPAFQERYRQYYALQGKDAVDQRDTYQDSMQGLAQQYRDSLGDPMQ